MARYYVWQAIMATNSFIRVAPLQNEEESLYYVKERIRSYTPIAIFVARRGTRVPSKLSSKAIIS